MQTNRVKFIHNNWIHLTPEEKVTCGEQMLI